MALLTSSMGPPRRACACTSAWSRDIPRATRYSIRASMYARSSASASSSAARPRKVSRKSRRTPERIPVMSDSAAGGFEHGAERAQVIHEIGRLRAKVSAPFPGHGVIPRAAVVLGNAPLGRDEVLLLHAMERLEERRVGDLQPS